nr:MAG TPA: Head Tail Connector Protein [Caudoviricetes sp.]
MNNYAEYEFYINEYQGNLSNDLFDILIVKASRDIDRNVNCRLTEDIINSLSDDEKYKLQYTTCELVDYINNYGSNSNNAKAKSISIDGISIDRTGTDELKTKSKKQIYDNLPIVLTRWL